MASLKSNNSAVQWSLKNEQFWCVNGEDNANTEFMIFKTFLYPPSSKLDLDQAQRRNDVKHVFSIKLVIVCPASEIPHHLHQPLPPPVTHNWRRLTCKEDQHRASLFILQTGLINVLERNTWAFCRVLTHQLVNSFLPRWGLYYSPPAKVQELLEPITWEWMKEQSNNLFWNI